MLAPGRLMVLSFTLTLIIWGAVRPDSYFSLPLCKENCNSLGGKLPFIHEILVVLLGLDAITHSEIKTPHHWAAMCCKDFWDFLYASVNQQYDFGHWIMKSMNAYYMVAYMSTQRKSNNYSCCLFLCKQFIQHHIKDPTLLTKRANSNEKCRVWFTIALYQNNGVGQKAGNSSYTCRPLTISICFPKLTVRTWIQIWSELKTCLTQLPLILVDLLQLTKSGSSPWKVYVLQVSFKI